MDPEIGQRNSLGGAVSLVFVVDEREKELNQRCLPLPPMAEEATATHDVKKISRMEIPHEKSGPAPYVGTPSRKLCRGEGLSRLVSGEW